MKLLKYLLYAVIALIILGVGAFFYLGMQSQNGSAPGLVGGTLTVCPASPNCVSSEADTEYEKRVDPLPADVWARLPEVIADMGGVLTVQEDTYLAAEFTSSLFRFVDDVEFRLDGDLIQLRSASRVGHSDAGVNGERVAALRTALEG